MVALNLDEELLSQIQLRAAENVDPRRAAWVHQNGYAFVVTEGRPYPSQELTDAERVVVDEVIELSRQLWGPFQAQSCFANSQQVVVLCDDVQRLVYVEGYVLSHHWPHLHGWLALNGKVIDVTLPPAILRDADARLPTRKAVMRALAREPARALGTFSDRAYFGVPFKREYVRRRMKATDSLGSLIDDWQHGSPLIEVPQDGWRYRRRGAGGGGGAVGAHDGGAR